LDTDSAYFNDDGAALVMLLRSPEKARVLGITLVAGNLWPLQGAEYMLHVLKLLNRPELPVYIGAREPLVHTRAMAGVEARQWGPLEFRGAFDEPDAHTRKDLKAPFGGRFSGLSVQPRSGVDYLIETLDRSPGSVTLLAIGPMTNIAMALRLRPDIASKIKQIVFMGGNVHVPGNATRAAELNFWFDPEAAQIVLRSSIPRKVMFGLDICNRAKLDKSHFDQIASAGTPVTDLFREDMGNRYPGFLRKPNVHAYIWDCLAAGYLLLPDFVTKTEKAYLDVDVRFGPRYGAVIPLDRQLAPDATPIDVMLDLDFDRFFALYKQLLTRK
ncbi:MAG TPA: nucleoside hydrolase, partial [Bryobacteraceae bacterium]|nr:nucleoside hydrolase [Bryobacteraceae bacterium]